MATRYLPDEDTSDDAGSNDDTSEAADAIATLLTTEAEPQQPQASSRKRKLLDVQPAGSSSSAKRKESQVWRFYERNADRTKVCKVCQKTFSVNTATGALRKHLSSHFGVETDRILSSSLANMEVTISPSTNTVTVTGVPLSSDTTDTTIVTTPLGRGRVRPAQHGSAPAATARAAPTTGTSTDHVKQRYKSSVWEHFVRHEDGRPECVHCQFLYSSNASTSGLRRHVEGHELERRGEKPTKRARASAKAGTLVSSGLIGKAGPTSLAIRSAPPKHAAAALLGEEYFLKLIIKQHLPAAEVVNRYSAVYRIATGKPADAEAVETRLKAMFAKKKDDLKLYIKQSTGKITLSLEVWNSADGHTYLLVAAHLLTETWDQVRFLLDCVLLSPDATPEAVRDRLLAILEDFQCADRVLAVATADDRAAGQGSNRPLASQAFRLFKAHMATTLGGPEIAQVNCIATGLGHCVEPALTCAVDQSNTVRRFLTVLLNSRKMSELQDRSHLNLQDYHELKTDSPASWTSTVVMLDAAVKMKLVIDDLVKQNEQLFEPFTQEDWTVLECILELVGNFHLAAQDIGKQDYPALSVALTLVDFLVTHLTEHKDRADVPSWAKKIAKEMLDRTTTFQRSLLTDVYFFGTILDPRHKLTTIPAGVSSHGVEENLRAAFARYLQPGSTTLPEATGNTLNNGVSTPYKAGSLMSAILKKSQQASTTVQPQMDELKQYLNTAVELPETDPLEWWENYRKVYPSLALMARDYITIPATCVPSGQLFVTERAVGKLRNRLDPEDVLLYVCLDSWLDLDLGHSPTVNGVKLDAKR